MQRIDPRVARTITRVMDVAEELLMEGGPNAVTIDAVVARSGVAKTSVYRHWASREALLVDLFWHVAPQVELSELARTAAGPHERVRAATRAIAESIADDRWERLLPALLMLKLRSGSIADVERRIREEMVATVGAVLSELVDEHRLTLPAPLPQSIHLLLGPLIMARLIGSFPVDQAFADQVADQFLAACAVRPRRLGR